MGAGTYDRAVGFSLFTLQVTHKIDADIDVERDFIVDSLEYACPEVDHEVIEGFSTGYHHVNGGGDRVHTDGDLPVLDLTGVPVPAAAARDLPHGVVRASRGYTDPAIDSGLAAPDPDALPMGEGAQQVRAGRPAAIVFASLAVLATVVVQAAEIVVPLLRHRSLVQTLNVGSDLPQDTARMVADVVLAVLVVLLVAIAVLCVLTFTGRARPRVWLMAGVTASIVVGEVDRRSLSGEASHSLGRDLALALSVLVLLGLSSPAARLWSRRTSQQRKLQRGKGRSSETGSRRRS